MSTICCAFNVYNDANALPGMLENASMFFDDLFCIHAGPDGKMSNDGTIEILEKWNVRTVFADIMEGFGKIRTRLIHECGCDWCWISDADERFLPNFKVLDCHGDEQFPHTLTPKNHVGVLDPNYCQGRLLRNIIDGAGDDYFSVRTIRRAWMDFTYAHPAQNWFKVPDHQLRCVRNNGHIGYTSDVKMHERLVDLRTGQEPKYFSVEDPARNVYHEHFNIFFKGQEPKQNTEDAETYDRLDPGVSERMWIKHFPKA